MFNPLHRVMDGLNFVILVFDDFVEFSLFSLEELSSSLLLLGLPH